MTDVRRARITVLAQVVERCELAISCLTVTGVIGAVVPVLALEVTRGVATAKDQLASVDGAVLAVITLGVRRNVPALIRTTVAVVSSTGDAIVAVLVEDALAARLSARLITAVGLAIFVVVHAVGAEETFLHDLNDLRAHVGLGVDLDRSVRGLDHVRL